MPDDIEEQIEELFETLIEAEQAGDVEAMGTIAGQLADLMDEEEE